MGYDAIMRQDSGCLCLLFNLLCFNKNTFKEFAVVRKCTTYDFGELCDSLCIVTYHFSYYGVTVCYISIIIYKGNT